jgi:hypothetical protein
MNRSKFTSIAGRLSIALALFIGVTAFAQVPRSNHVYIVAEENRSYERIVGSASMPYLNGLLAKGAVATQFYSNMHGSLENYLIVTSGQYLTHNNDTLAVFNVDNIERHLLSNGKTFKSYAQSLPYAGFTGLYSGAYMKRHAPLPYFTEMGNSSLIKEHVSTTQLAKDIANGTLPNFAFITPDGNNDMHNCGANLGACFWTADQFLKNTIGRCWLPRRSSPAMESPAIWADEADLGSDNRCSATVSTGCGGHILVATIGPQVTGYKSTTTYHHQSVLKTMLEALGTTANFPAAANTAPDMREFFKGNAGGTVPPTTAAVVQVSSPTSSTVTGPGVSLAASATAPNPVTFMRIYVDNVSVASASTSKIRHHKHVQGGIRWS